MGQVSGIRRRVDLLPLGLIAFNDASMATLCKIVLVYSKVNGIRGMKLQESWKVSLLELQSCQVHSHSTGSEIADLISSRRSGMGFRSDTNLEK